MAPCFGGDIGGGGFDASVGVKATGGASVFVGANNAVASPCETTVLVPLDGDEHRMRHMMGVEFGLDDATRTWCGPSGSGRAGIATDGADLDVDVAWVLVHRVFAEDRPIVTLGDEQGAD